MQTDAMMGLYSAGSRKSKINSIFLGEQGWGSILSATILSRKLLEVSC